MGEQTTQKDLAKRAGKGDTAAREELSRLAEGGDEEAKKLLGEQNLDARYMDTKARKR